MLGKEFYSTVLGAETVKTVPDSVAPCNPELKLRENESVYPQLFLLRQWHRLSSLHVGILVQQQTDQRQ